MEVVPGSGRPPGWVARQAGDGHPTRRDTKQNGDGQLPVARQIEYASHSLHWIVTVALAITPLGTASSAVSVDVT
jgi:hypothetical protein